MSLLSQYYKREYMVKTLSTKVNLQKDGYNNNIVNNNGNTRSQLSNINETYESAAQGFFAVSGTVFVQ